jgi:GDPmannose 4,6-dehydratase
MKKIAFVTGMTGQDGPYLAKHLLEHDYKVYGLVKRYSNPNLSNLAYLGIEDDVELITGDITDDANMNHLMKSLRPNEFYNLAAQSFVGASWELNKQTSEVNAIGVLNILNAIVGHNPRFEKLPTFKNPRPTCLCPPRALRRPALQRPPRPSPTATALP